jgi:hypothetical protein
MTSMWENNRLDSQGVERDENQLELFQILSSARIGTVQPSVPRSDNSVGALVGKVRPADSRKAAGALSPVKADPSSVNAGPIKPDAAGLGSPVPGTLDAGHAETIASSSTGCDILDVVVSDAQHLRRIEESIHGLTSAGATPMPRIAPLPPMVRLVPLGAHEDDSLLPDPDTLFPPRAPRRVNAVAAGAAKVLLASVLVAPTTYFVASWLQFSDGPSDPATVSAVAWSSDPAAVTAVAPAVSTPAPLASVLQTSAPNAAAPKATASQQASVSNAVRGSHAGEVIVAMAEPPKAAPEPPIAAPAEAASVRPMPVLLPVKRTLGPDEIATMVERGRALFNAGDVDAARLFFRRAANAGDSQAAVAMGSTYDPEVLAQRFIRGIQGNAEEAQRWYEKAKDVGQHVEMLAQRR